MSSIAASTISAAARGWRLSKASWGLAAAVALALLALALAPRTPKLTFDFIPLPHTLGFSIVLCAVSLWCQEARQRTLAIVFVTPVFLSVAATLIAWVLGVAPPFDIRLFAPTAAGALPPPLAIEAAVPIALISAALFFLAVGAPAATAVTFAWATGVFLLVAPAARLGVDATLANDAAAILYAQRVEIVLSAALSCLGGALMTARSVGRIAIDRGARWRTLLVASAAAATIVLWYSLRSGEVRQLRSEVNFAMAEATRALRAGLTADTNAADRLWQHWLALKWRVPDELFLNDAQIYMQQETAVLATAMLDTYGRVLKLARRTIPFGAQPAREDTVALASGQELDSIAPEAVRRELMRSALETRVRQRSEPVTVDGANVTFAIAAIFDENDAPLGGFLLLYRRDVAMAEILSDVAPEFHLYLFIDDKFAFERPARSGINESAAAYKLRQTHTFLSPLRYSLEVTPGIGVVERALSSTPLIVLLFAWASLLLLMFGLYNERRAQLLFRERNRMLDQSLDVICTLDGSGRYVSVNVATLRVFGYEPTELVGRPITDFAQAEDIPLLLAYRRDAQQGRPEAPRPIRFRHKDGRIVYMDGAAHWSASEQLFYCDMRDVTAQHTLEVAREHAAGTFRIGVEQAGCVVYEYEARTGRIEWVGAVQALTGYSPDELAALKFEGWMQLVHADDAEHVRQMLQRCLETEQPHTVDYRLRRKDGSYVPVLDRGRHIQASDDREPRLIGALLDLTAIRQQEIALRRSEERYRIIANQVGAVIIERETASGRIRVFGPVEQIFGYTREQMESRPLNRSDTMIHPDDRAHYFAAVDEAERTLSSYYVEHRRRHRGGHYIYIASRGVVLPGIDGRAEREIISITDITDRKRAELALQQSEERFRFAVEQSSQIVYEYGYDSATRVSSRRFAGAIETMLGYTPQEMHELYADSDYALAHDDDVPHVVECVRQAVRAGGAFQMEHRMRHKDGHYVFVESRGAMRRDEQGKAIGILGVLLDISASKSLEADRQRYTEQLRALAQIANKVGTVLSLHELLRYIATSMRELLGVNAAAALVVDMQLAPEQAVAVSYAEHYGVQRGAAASLSPVELHARVRSTNTPQRLTAAQMAADPLLAGMTQHDDLRHPLRGWLAAPLIARDGANLGLLELSDKVDGEFTDSDLQVLNQLAGLTAVAIENIRLYATLEERVAARTRELEISNRELEAFSYSVSHDLRAPLRAIAGFSSILETEYSGSLDANAQRYLHRITAGVERMANLIDDLLSLARVSRADLKRETVDLTELCKLIVKRHMERVANRSIDIAIDPRMKTVADPRLVEVALENLIENALKFTGTRAQANIRIGHRRVDGRYVFFVADNGVGFDPQYASNLFGVFQRLHSASDFPGTGVGLATVQRIVQRHQGRIWAEAEADRGATFYFTFGGNA